MKFWFLLFLITAGCSASTRQGTCTAYEAAVEPARAMCHRACDAIPGRCPWAQTAGGEEEVANAR